MTIEQLLGCSAEKLEAMSDKELEEYFAPFFPTTRPEHVQKQRNKKKGSTLLEKYDKQNKQQKAKEIFAKLGLDPDVF